MAEQQLGEWLGQLELMSQVCDLIGSLILPSVLLTTLQLAVMASIHVCLLRLKTDPTPRAH